MACYLENIFTNMMFFSLAERSGALFEKRIDQGCVLVWGSRVGSCSLEIISTKITFFVLVDMVGVLLENRLRRGRFCSVVVKSGALFETSLSRMFF